MLAAVWGCGCAAAAALSHSMSCVCCLQGFDKLQKTASEQQQVTSALMQERQLLQQQVQLLQQQSQDQAEKLRRTQLQKQRLEGLCRTLQVRAGCCCVPTSNRPCNHPTCNDVYSLTHLNPSSQCVYWVGVRLG